MIFMKRYLLQKKYLKKFNILLFLFFYFFSTLTLNADIFIVGNKNISSEKIRSYFPKKIDLQNINLINEIQKKIFETGFFKNVNVTIKNNDVHILVEENPLVNFFYISGITKSSMEKKIENFISIKENNIFQLYKVKSDIKQISLFLNSLGYLNNVVTYELFQIENNKVNVFYNIKLNNLFKINRIFFVGNKYFKSSKLYSEINSTEYGWWKFLSNSSNVSENLINNDVVKLKNFYLDNGFYDAQITSSSVTIVDNHKANITFSIESGDKYYIFTDRNNNVNFSNLIDSDIKKIIQYEINKLNGKVYSKDKINTILKSVNNFLIKRNLDLDFDIKENKVINKKIINLKFSLRDQSIKKIVNKIKITGNNITEDKVIRNNVFFSEGDLFNKSKLISSIEKIKGTSLFKEVNYKLNDTNDNIDITINVVEQPTGEIAAGAGAGTSGATIMGSLKEKNFLGKGLSLEGNLNLGTQKTFGKISFSNPDFNNSGNTVKTSIFIENNTFDNASYENKLYGFNLSTYYEIYDKIFFSPGFGVDLDSVKANSNASSIVKNREGDYFTSKIFYNVSKNTTNKSFNPTSGYIIGIGQNLSTFVSDVPYLNNKFFGSYYNEYKENFIGSIKYRIESINGFNEDIKFSDRLFVSDSNLRGFASRSIGPTLSLDYAGGNYSYFGNLSSTFPNFLPEKWNAITNVFFDTANVWGTDDNRINDSNKIRSSLGLGFSWISPIGPISFTYAEPISKASTDNVEQFNFRIGSAF